MLLNADVRFATWAGCAFMARSGLNGLSKCDLGWVGVRSAILAGWAFEVRSGLGGLLTCDLV